jgi:DNA-binding NarL/FixJ family response regulator
MPAGALLERDEELAALEWVMGAADSREGRSVVISGEAGIGKTRLLSEAATRATAAGHELITARGIELEHELGWGLAVEALEPALATRSPAARSELLSGRAMPARSLLEGTDQVPGTAPAPQLAALAAALTAVTLRMAAERPLAVIVDDAHWADEESLRWLGHLASRLTDGVPVALLVAFRSHEPASASELLDHLLASAAVRLELGPLSLTATSQLVQATIGDADAVRAVHDVTRGNPFMVDQVMRSIDPSHVTVQAIEDTRPRGLRALVLPRIARLGPDARSLSEVVAVLAEGAELRIAGALTGLPDEAVAGAAEQLTLAGVFADKLPLEFAHPLLRSVVADSLTAARADYLHRTAAQLLAQAGARPTESAIHLLPASPVGEDWARTVLVQAGRAAMDRGAPGSAAELFGRARLEPADGDAHRLMLDHGRALLQAGSESALAVLRQALAQTPDAFERASAALDVGDALMALDLPADAVEVYANGVAAVVDPEEPLRMHLLAQRALAALALREDREVAASAVIDAVDAAGRWPAAARRSALTLQGVVAVWAGQPASQCVALLEAALAAPRYGELPALEWGPDLAWLMPMLAWCDAFERRDAFLESVIARARNRGALVDLALATAHRAYGLMRRGRIPEADRDARTAIGLFDDMQAEPNAMANAVALEALIARGEFDAAEAFVQRASSDGDEDRVVYLAFLDARAKLRIIEGRIGEAHADLELMSAEMEQNFFHCPAAIACRPRLAVVRHALGGVDEARRAAGDEVERARAFGAPRGLGVALLALGAVESAARAEVALVEAVDVLTSSAARVEHAQALLALGSLLRRHSRRTEAIPVLRQALDVAASCGADAIAREARTELGVAGARPRRERLRGPDSLTEGERRVAALAADGLTNTDIARQLVVSLRTVETHLTSAYRKLDIKGRPELATALGSATGAGQGSEHSTTRAGHASSP